MEEVCFIGAVIAFALAVCSLVACVVIFVRAGVPDAIRFLQHRPTKKSSTSSKAMARRGRGGKAFVGGGLDDGNRVTSSDEQLISRKGDSSTLSLKGDVGSEGDTDVLTAPSEGLTDVLKEQDSESPTGLLGGTADQESENPTGLLPESDDSESPTGLLGDLDSESPTGLLRSRPLKNDSENPTSLLGVKDDIEKDAHDENLSGVAQHEETTFRFILKQSELVVHTQETIA